MWSRIILSTYYLLYQWQLNVAHNCRMFLYLGHSQQQKKVGIPFQMAYFVQMPLIYQISTYTSLYTRIFDFSHFCAFHIMFVYQNSYTNPHTRIFDIYLLYTNLGKLPFLFFAMVRHFLWDICHFSWIPIKKYCQCGHWFSINVCGSMKKYFK